MQEIETKKYRLVTRSNLDGIISAALLKKINKIDEIVFVHPKDVQDGKIEITANDIVTNLPFVDSAHMAFDHKLEHDKNTKLNPNHAIFTDARSVSEIIYEYYDLADSFGEEVLPLIEAANKAKSANYTKEEILLPRGWNFLSFITDPRTGLGRFRKFKISNYELMKKLTKLCMTHTIDEILESQDVKDRVDLYNKHQQDFIDQLERCVKVEDDVAVIDLRDEEVIYPGNRFMVYVMYPEVTTSIHVLNGKDKESTVFALGKSIINKNSNKNINNIVRKYNGGGHSDAGTCQVAQKDAQKVKLELVNHLKTLVCEEV
jgi:nanoRNase/pAp phosphatase (c-di-AMP/oligoRNAs hydrolase)